MNLQPTIPNKKQVNNGISSAHDHLCAFEYNTKMWRVAHADDTLHNYLSEFFLNVHVATGVRLVSSKSLVSKTTLFECRYFRK